jgi:hypothetical protein
MCTWAALCYSTVCGPCVCWGAGGGGACTISDSPCVHARAAAGGYRLLQALCTQVVPVAPAGDQLLCPGCYYQPVWLLQTCTDAAQLRCTLQRQAAKVGLQLCCWRAPLPLWC